MTNKVTNKPMNQKRKKRQKQQILIRVCSVCGHPLVIFLVEKKRIPRQLFYGGRVFGIEYWECAVCNIYAGVITDNW